MILRTGLEERNKMAQSGCYQSVGRRKEAVARVRVLPGNGLITVNGKPITEVFRGEVYEKLYTKPFEVTKTVGKYAANVKIVGGGSSSRIDAIVHGLSRALAKVNTDYRSLLKHEGLLTRDARVKERRKYGFAHKARAKKQSPKR